MSRTQHSAGPKRMDTMVSKYPFKTGFCSNTEDLESHGRCKGYVTQTVIAYCKCTMAGCAHVEADKKTLGVVLPKEEPAVNVPIEDDLWDRLMNS